MPFCLTPPHPPYHTAVSQRPPVPVSLPCHRCPRPSDVSAATSKSGHLELAPWQITSLVVERKHIRRLQVRGGVRLRSTGCAGWAVPIGGQRQGFFCLWEGQGRARVEDAGQGVVPWPVEQNPPSFPLPHIPANPASLQQAAPLHPVLPSTPFCHPGPHPVTFALPCPPAEPHSADQPAPRILCG